MKIQKVEIQAFRAFDKVENGTFDFSTKSNEVADFISIFAPNGFGKTSFYDAVEWGYTNRISRFDRKKGFSAELAKSERTYLAENLNKKEQWIIRNRLSKLDEGFVKVYTNSSVNPILNFVPKVKKGEPDYKFEKQKPRKNTSYFHEVLLSQEWIDAFLKEDNAATRYDKFIQSFGDVDLDKKYRTVVELIRINQEKLKGINEQLKGFQLKLKLDFDNELLSKINSAIDEFNIKGENLPKVDAHFTEKEVLYLANQISERQYDLKVEINRLEGNREKVNQILSGKTNEQLSAESYFETRKQLAEQSAQLEKLRAQKGLLKERNNQRTLLSDLEKELIEKLEEDKHLAELMKAFPSFVSLREKISEEQQNIESNKVEVADFKAALGDIIKSIDTLNANKTTKQTGYQKLSDRLKQLPGSLQKLSELKEELESTTESTEKRVDDLEKTKESISEQESNALALSAFKSNIEDNVLPTQEHEYYEQYREFNAALSTANDELKEVQENLEKTQDRLSETDSMNQELKEFIGQGATIVNRNQSSNCPLCQHEYESFTVLTEKISNNPLLGNRINELLEQKRKLEVEKSRLKRLIEEKKGKLLIKLNDELEKQDATLKTLIEQRDSISRSINELDDKKRLFNDQIKENLEKLGLSDYPSKDFETRLKTETEVAKSALDEVIDSQEKSSVKQNKLQEKIQVQEDQIKRSEEKIESYKNQPEYLIFISFQKNRLMNEFPSKDDLEFFKKMLRLKSKKIREKLTELKTVLENLNEKLKGIRKDDIETSIAESESKREAIRTKVFAFENLVESFLDIFLSNLSQEELLKTLENEKEKILTTTKLVENKITDLGKIDGYRENVIPFLEFQESQRKKSNLEAEKRFLTKVVSKELEQERIQISKFIHQQVESFFYQDLINTLYRKIDPHPSYKKISFKCDFSSTAKPLLNIFVSDDIQSTIVPTLYFSTAQLNILSLSIFLAKALNVRNDKGEPVDCIFIDDPIQSMDSINILSTIDLFRSIVVNLGKQIILSTHDENFQNLLKKKIPADLFSAKYFELETFGKVKEQ